MDSIKRLKELGAEEISRRTHIDKRHIERIINKDFENLKKINTLGFVKIINRECGVDMSGWMSEYEEYLGGSDDVGEQHIPNLSSQPIQEHNGGSRFLKIFILLVVLGALWYFGEDKIRAYFEAPKTSEKSIENYNTLPAVVEAGVKMVEEPKEPEVSISDILQEDKKESHVVLPSQSDVIERVELASEEKASIQNDENIIGENLEEIIIKPKGEIWVGVVYLDSRDKKQFITRENITIDTSKDQLVRTGHGDFTISLNGENKVYFQQAPVRFKFIDGKLIQISANEFLELNGGKNW